MEKYGFVYIWYDRKHKRFYVGSHWGHENDGYVCSSDWMKKAYKRRPCDFKRRIIVRGIDNKLDTLITEEKYLSMIKPEERRHRYYNIQLSCKHNIETLKDDRRSVTEKMSATKRAFWDSKESNESRSKISALHKSKGTKPPSRKGKVPWNKGLSKDTDLRVAAASINQSKAKRKRAKPATDETRKLISEKMKEIWQERKRRKCI